MGDDNTSPQDSTSPQPAADQAPRPAAGQAAPAPTGAAVPRARKAPAKKATPAPATKAPAHKAPAKKAAPRKAPAKKAAATAAEPDHAATSTRRPAKKPAAAPAPVRAGVPATALAQWAEAVAEAVRQADQPPQRLAELAVTEFGPRAAGWADWLRATYPGVPPQAMARLAAQQARQAGWLVAGAGMAGPLAPVLHPAASCAVRVLLVLRVAAAYGHDPTDPARAHDVLDLFGLGKDAATGPFARALGSLGRFTRLAGLRRRRGPARALLALVELGDERDRLERLAHRAARHFRPR